MVASQEVARSVWRYGYGSNIGITTLKKKKNLNPSQYLAGTIKGWELFFNKGFAYVEPVRIVQATCICFDKKNMCVCLCVCVCIYVCVCHYMIASLENLIAFCCFFQGFAAIRPDPNAELHGTAFCISSEEAEGLDKQEGGYNVLPCTFISYDGKLVENVGLYVPKKQGQEEGLPSKRYLGLLQNGAKEAPLSKEWQEKLGSFEYYITPNIIRDQTKQWIDEFHADPARKNVVWNSELLSKHDGSNTADYPVIHTSVMEYVIALPDDFWIFSSWKGHNITRRNLVHFKGDSVDKGDIRFGQQGYRPFPNMSAWSEEQMEYVMQNLESVLHRGGTIVARLEDFLEDQNNLN